MPTIAEIGTEVTVTPHDDVQIVYAQIPTGVEVVIGRRGRASILLQASVASLHRSPKRA